MIRRDLRLRVQISRKNAVIFASPPEGMHRFQSDSIDVQLMAPSTSPVGLGATGSMVRVVFRKCV